jgi:hypothetical protein
MSGNQWLPHPEEQHEDLFERGADGADHCTEEAAREAAEGEIHLEAEPALRDYPYNAGHARRSMANINVNVNLPKTATASGNSLSGSLLDTDSIGLTVPSLPMRTAPQSSLSEAVAPLFDYLLSPTGQIGCDGDGPPSTPPIDLSLNLPSNLGRGGGNSRTTASVVEGNHGSPTTAPLPLLPIVDDELAPADQDTRADCAVSLSHTEKQHKDTVVVAPPLLDSLPDYKDQVRCETMHRGDSCVLWLAREETTILPTVSPNSLHYKDQVRDAAPMAQLPNLERTAQAAIESHDIAPNGGLAPNQKQWTQPDSASQIERPGLLPPTGLDNVHQECQPGYKDQVNATESHNNRNVECSARPETELGGFERAARSGRGLCEPSHGRW